MLWVPCLQATPFKFLGSFPILLSSRCCWPGNPPKKGKKQAVKGSNKKRRKSQQGGKKTASKKPRAEDDNDEEGGHDGEEGAGDNMSDLEACLVNKLIVLKRHGVPSVP